MHYATFSIPKRLTLIFNSVNRPVNSTSKANVFNKFFTLLTNFSVNVNIAVDISMNSNTIVCGKFLSGKDSHHIDTSQFTCSADQLAGFAWCRFWGKVIFKQFIM